MSSRRLKPACFVLEGLQAFLTSYYFYYLFFYLRDHFGFGNAPNLAACALHGFIYTFSSWLGGRFSQRAGYFTALSLGLGIMVGALLFSALSVSAPTILVGLGLWTVGLSLTWPALEALASEGERAGGLRRMIGVYNLVWAGGSALAYFVGGALKAKLGDQSIFWLPALAHLAKLFFVLWWKGRGPEPLGAQVPGSAGGPPDGESWPTGLRVPPRAFLFLAWMANLFAYVAINAAVPVIPQLAERLHLSTEEAGFFCSLWFFARLVTFAALWRWIGWHYKFRWLLAAFLVMIASFIGMLTASSLAVIGLAQIGLGCGVGLVYYSSLYYSMAVGETKGEHGGIHEAAIGSGIFGGAAIGSAAEYVLGGQSSSTWVVSAVLLLGLGGLLAARRRFARRAALVLACLAVAGAGMRAGAATLLAAPGHFLVHSNGSVESATEAAVLQLEPAGTSRGVRYDFGLPANPPEQRELENGALPICRQAWVHKGIRYTQIVLLTRLQTGDLGAGESLPADAVLMVQLIGENTATEYAEASAVFAVRPDGKPQALELRGSLVHLASSGEPRIVAAIDIPSGGVAGSSGPELKFGGNMPPGTSGAMTIKIPLFSLRGTNQADLLHSLEFDEELKRVKKFWTGQTAAGARGCLPVALAPSQR